MHLYALLSGLVAAIGPVALGLGIAMVPGLRNQAKGALHRLVLALATAVVLLLMVPHAVSEVGWPALGVFLVSLAVPVAIERLAGHDHHHHDGHDPEHAMDVELGFAGLLLHQSIEGGELGAVFITSHNGWAVAGALALHTVPLIAAVSHGCMLRVGLRGTLLRAGALALASGAGVLVGHFGADALDGIEPWVGAAVGGLLLHTLWHTWATPRPR